MVQYLNLFPCLVQVILEFEVIVFQSLDVGLIFFGLAEDEILGHFFALPAFLIILCVVMCLLYFIVSYWFFMPMTRFDEGPPQYISFSY